jgi:hypothetical protein
MSTGKISIAGEATRVKSSEHNPAADGAGQEGMANRLEALERQLTMITENLALLNGRERAGNEIAAQAGTESDKNIPQKNSSQVKTKKGENPGSDDSSSESSRESTRKSSQPARAGRTKERSRNSGQRHRVLEYSALKVHRFFKDTLLPLQIEKPGDAKFPAARDAWMKTLTQFPVFVEEQESLIPLAFTSSAAAKLQQCLARLPTKMPANQIWDALELEFFNVSHRGVAREALITMRLERDENVQDYGGRVRTVGESLNADPEDIRHFFIAGLPSSFQASALATGASYDHLIATMHRIVGKERAQNRTPAFRSHTRPFREPLNAMGEGQRDNPELAMPVEYLNALREAGEVVGHAPGIPADPRYEQHRCHNCGRFGHLFRSCRWPAVKDARAQATMNSKNGRVAEGNHLRKTS